MIVTGDSRVRARLCSPSIMLRQYIMGNKNKELFAVKTYQGQDAPPSASVRAEAPLGLMTKWQLLERKPTLPLCQVSIAATRRDTRGQSLTKIQTTKMK